MTYKPPTIRGPSACRNRAWRPSDRRGQVTDQKWTDNSTPANVKDEYGYAYDYDGNRSYRQNSSTGGTNLDEKYVYDDLDRLTEFKRGTLSSSDITDAASTFLQSWLPSSGIGLDELGNWNTFIWDNDGGAGPGSPVTQTRTHSAVNEITGISGGSWVAPTYDANGNMITCPKPGSETNTLHLTYDAWNRMVKSTDGTNTIATYAYNGLNWRIRKVDQSQSPNVTTDYYYNENWQVLEEQRTVTGYAGPYTYIQWVWDARYIDAPVCRFRDANGGNTGDGTLEETLYYATDANMNVTALVSTAGDVVERYQYDAYGKVTFLQGAKDLSGNPTTDWASRSASIADNQILFGGYRYDPETGLYHVRNRMYHPTLGRWGQRDPLGYVDSYNFYEYAGGTVFTALDPSGYKTIKIPIVAIGAYYGFGIDVKLEATEEYHDCCDSTGKVIKDGKFHLDISGTSSIGLGIGGKIKVAGVQLDLLYKAFGAEGKLSLIGDIDACATPKPTAKITLESTIARVAVFNSFEVGAAMASLKGKTRIDGAFIARSTIDATARTVDLWLGFNGNADIKAEVWALYREWDFNVPGLPIHGEQKLYEKTWTF